MDVLCLRKRKVRAERGLASCWSPSSVSSRATVTANRLNLPFIVATNLFSHSKSCKLAAI